MAIGSKTGGRQKGAKNKATLEKEAATVRYVQAAKNEGITPLEYMLKVLRDEEKSDAERFNAAKEAAPYMHARLSAVKHEGDSENPVKVVTRIELYAPNT